MRKDLRIGLAIGLVLLAVLVVYMLIPGGNDAAKRRAGQASAQQPQTGAASESGSAAGESDNTAPSEPPAGEPAAPSPDKGAQPKDQSDVFANDTRTTGSDMTSGGTGGAPKPSPSAGDGNTDWANLLYAPLRTTTPGDAATNGTSPRSQRQTTGQNDQADASFKSGPAPERETASARNASPRTHTVQPGETLTKIAEATYGSQRYYLAIKQANPNIDADHLKIGDVINLPDRAEVTRSGGGAEASAEQPINEATEYRVQAGDSLHKIAVKRFGTIQKADEIYELNRDKIGPNPARLRVNMVLKMPAAGGGSNGNGSTRAEAADRGGEAQTAGASTPAGR
jgi:nucleoid-associated protein YgaU